MAWIKASREVIGELRHKVQIVTEEPDLQESYGVTLGQAESADWLLSEAERDGVIDLFLFADEVAEMLAGEADDAATVARDRAKDANRNGDKVAGRAEQRLARDLEKLRDEIEAMQEAAQ